MQTVYAIKISPIFYIANATLTQHDPVHPNTEIIPKIKFHSLYFVNLTFEFQVKRALDAQLHKLGLSFSVAHGSLVKL